MIITKDTLTADILKNINGAKEFFESLNKSFISQKGNYIEIDIDPVNML